MTLVLLRSVSIGHRRLSQDDVIKWKHFPRYWPFVRGIHRSPVNSPHKGQWRGALMFSLICVSTNGWVNTREAGNFRRYRAHYDVIVMMCRHCDVSFFFRKPWTEWMAASTAPVRFVCSLPRVSQTTIVAAIRICATVVRITPSKFSLWLAVPPLPLCWKKSCKPRTMYYKVDTDGAISKN